MDIKVENLTKIYGKEKAVDSISFNVKPGEILGFLGPNGAGKSTTMKIITCFMAQTSGDVKIDGHSNLENSIEIKKKIGYLPENNPLYLDMPVLEYLSFVAELQGVPKDKVQERLIEMVMLCGLDDEKHKKIGELSKGYRQRVGLAQAMIHDPEILILDEPTTGLDPNQIIEIRKLIKELGRHKTVILSTHILPEVEATCDRILIINKGKIVADGTSESLRKQAQGGGYIRIKIVDAKNSDELFSSLLELNSVTKVEPVKENEKVFNITGADGEQTQRDIFNLCVKNKWTLLEMTMIETKLEDIFKELTTN